MIWEELEEETLKRRIGRPAPNVMTFVAVVMYIPQKTLIVVKENCPIQERVLTNVLEHVMKGKGVLELNIILVANMTTNVELT